MEIVALRPCRFLRDEKLQELFFRMRDYKRYKEYIKQVLQGTEKIAAGALLPHELLVDAFTNCEVAELQWRRIVKDLSVKGKLSNCIAVCDVSGSMVGTPLEVSVAMGLMISDLSEEPWKGKVITFSEEPELHQITGDTLKLKGLFVRQMRWGCNTDLQKVFDRILQVAVEGKLPPAKMIKRVFVFTDMEFDEESESYWEMDYMVIEKKFKESRYGSAVPEIVFWNLRFLSSTPVPFGQKELVSGYSKNLMTLFCHGSYHCDEYQKLKVFD